MDNFIHTCMYMNRANYSLSAASVCHKCGSHFCVYMVYTISHLVSLIDKINVLEFSAEEFALKNKLKSVFVG